LHELRNVAGVDQIGRELNDVGPPGADRLQRGLDVGEGLAALRIEVVGADDTAVLVGRQLSGNEDELGRLHARDL